VPKEEACGIRCSFYLSTHGTRCTANWQRVEPIHAFVLAAVKRVALDPEAFLEYRQSQRDDGGTQDRIDGVNKSLQALQHRWDRWNQAFEIGAISLNEMLEHRERILHQTTALKLERDELASLQESSTTIADALQDVQQIAGLLDEMTNRELNQVYLQLIDHVLLARKQEPVIVWL